MFFQTMLPGSSAPSQQEMRVVPPLVPPCLSLRQVWGPIAFSSPASALPKANPDTRSAVPTPDSASSGVRPPTRGWKTRESLLL